MDAKIRILVLIIAIFATNVTSRLHKCDSCETNCHKDNIASCEQKCENKRHCRGDFCFAKLEYTKSELFLTKGCSNYAPEYRNACYMRGSKEIHEIECFCQGDHCSNATHAIDHRRTVIDNRNNKSSCCKLRERDSQRYYRDESMKWRMDCRDTCDGDYCNSNQEGKTKTCLTGSLFYYHWLKHASIGSMGNKVCHRMKNLDSEEPNEENEGQPELYDEIYDDCFCANTTAECNKDSFREDYNKYEKILCNLKVNHVVTESQNTCGGTACMIQFSGQQIMCVEGTTDDCARSYQNETKFGCFEIDEPKHMMDAGCRIQYTHSLLAHGPLRVRCNCRYEKCNTKRFMNKYLNEIILHNKALIQKQEKQMKANYLTTTTTTKDTTTTITATASKLRPTIPRAMPTYRTTTKRPKINKSSSNAEKSVRTNGHYTDGADETRRTLSLLLFSLLLCFLSAP